MTLGGLNSRICIYMKERRKSYEKTGKILEFYNSWNAPTCATVLLVVVPYACLYIPYMRYICDSLNFITLERSCIPLEGEGGTSLFRGLARLGTARHGWPWSWSEGLGGGVILPCYFASQGTSLFRGYGWPRRGKGELPPISV